MARGDLQVVGMSGTIPRRVAASATRFEVGEPIIGASRTMTSGASSTNVWTLAAIDVGVLGTDVFGGIAKEGAEPKNSTGTLVAQTVTCAVPVPMIGRIRGVAETAASVDTAAELLALINDRMLIDYNATGAADGGELYTIKVAPSASTSAFELIEGNTFKGTLDVVCDERIYRNPSITDTVVDLTAD